MSDARRLTHRITHGWANRSFRVLNWLLIPVWCFLVLIVRILRPILVIRIGGINAGRLGHLVMDQEMLLSEEAAGVHRRTTRTIDLRYVWTAGLPIANHLILALWTSRFHIVPSWLFQQVDTWNRKIPGGQANAIPYRKGPKLLNQHNDLHNIMYLTDTQMPYPSRLRNEAECILRDQRPSFSLEMPYICIHVRDSGYFSAVGAEGLARDATRNADIGSYSEAITYLLDEGYAVVRLGSRVTEPLPIQHPNLWDYANDGSRTELLDLVLPAHCSFFISTLSGPDKIAQAFRRPILFTNLAPLKSCSLWMRDSLIAPKRLVDSAGSRIPWEEVFTTDLYMMNSGELASHGIKLQPNTRSELRSATEEMLQQFVGIEDACSELDAGWQNVLMTIPSYLKAGGVRARFARALLSS